MSINLQLLELVVFKSQRLCIAFLYNSTHVASFEHFDAFSVLRKRQDSRAVCVTILVGVPQLRWQNDLLLLRFGVCALLIQ